MTAQGQAAVLRAIRAPRSCTPSQAQRPLVCVSCAMAAVAAQAAQACFTSRCAAWFH